MFFRDYTQKVYRIIGILSKNLLDKKYNKLDYIAKKINFKRFISNNELKDLIDIDILNQNNTDIKE